MGMTRGQTRGLCLTPPTKGKPPRDPPEGIPWEYFRISTGSCKFGSSSSSQGLREQSLSLMRSPGTSLPLAGLGLRGFPPLQGGNWWESGAFLNPWMSWLQPCLHTWICTPGSLPAPRSSGSFSSPRAPPIQIVSIRENLNNPRALYHVSSCSFNIFYYSPAQPLLSLLPSPAPRGSGELSGISGEQQADICVLWSISRSCRQHGSNFR